jgi:ribosomal protein L9
LATKENALELYQKLHDLTLDFTLKKSDKNIPFGSISFREILQGLADNGINIGKNQLLNFHSLNKVGENDVTIRLNSDLVAKLKVIIQ